MTASGWKGPGRKAGTIRSAPNNLNPSNYFLDVLMLPAGPCALPVVPPTPPPPTAPCSRPPQPRCRHAARQASGSPQSDQRANGMRARLHADGRGYSRACSLAPHHPARWTSPAGQGHQRHVQLLPRASWRRRLHRHGVSSALCFRFVGKLLLVLEDRVVAGCCLPSSARPHTKPSPAPSPPQLPHHLHDLQLRRHLQALHARWP